MWGQGTLEARPPQRRTPRSSWAPGSHGGPFTASGCTRDGSLLPLAVIPLLRRPPATHPLCVPHDLEGVACVVAPGQRSFSWEARMAGWAVWPSLEVGVHRGPEDSCSSSCCPDGGQKQAVGGLQSCHTPSWEGSPDFRE